MAKIAFLIFGLHLNEVIDSIGGHEFFLVVPLSIHVKKLSLLSNC